MEDLLKKDLRKILRGRNVHVLINYIWETSPDVHTTFFFFTFSSTDF